MRFNMQQRIIGLFLVCILLLSAECFAQELSFAQKIKYKKATVMLPSGYEVPALVGRFNGKVSYCLNKGEWVEAPGTYQEFYDNRSEIKHNLMLKQRKHLKNKKYRTKREEERLKGLEEALK